MSPKIESSWKEVLKQAFEAQSFLELKKFLIAERSNYTVFPPGAFIFNAFNLTPFNQVKVVIIGQDPYHGEKQAHGLSFSVPEGVKPPPSLVNIFKEIHADLGFDIPKNGNLEKWAKQGVLLLNATLTVRANTAGSHQKKGWEPFTDEAIKQLSALKNNLVFLLWGRFAQDKASLIDSSKHLVLKAAHPSPFSAYNGFFGCKHFSATNSYLLAHNLASIDWKIE
ncbi:MAG: uracil-DNA glycosylase [Bacteroidales bacterium]|nr:uracil-DNA glycosylase [Bacteroidales bacterium]